ncbi:chemotaxis protein CheW [Pseudoduganella sp. FT25W]|uniref:Chemotaxis protein CheW n=1 Tax=Duganella alba TaxID=2666081 RepID=A0A6L5QM02_9BURK|nr:chemotaxis protein CheW [Duganella alba]MRX10675.1 chemotaxis protein CheW [Duganella alba]MRX18683.1 chemotaxis protein CheW [Duganella alba]
MKLLVFHIGADRYGLRLRDVVRVLPLLELKQLPLAPDAVAGLMDLHGASVPVIDLCRASGLPSGEDHFDTRIIVADYVTPEGAHHQLGLRAERVLGVQDVRDDQLVDSGVRAAPFLGQVASDSQGMLQLVELEQLLPAELRALLFQSADSAP